MEDLNVSVFEGCGCKNEKYFVSLKFLLYRTQISRGKNPKRNEKICFSGQRMIPPHSNFHYDNVRGEMRGPFVRFNHEGGIATLGGHEPRIHYPGQAEAFQPQFRGRPPVLDENRATQPQDVFLQDSQFV